MGSTFNGAGAIHGGEDAIGEVIARTSHPPTVRDDKIVRALGRWKQQDHGKDVLCNAWQNGVSLDGMTVYLSSLPPAYHLKELFEAGVTHLVLPDSLKEVTHKPKLDLAADYNVKIRRVKERPDHGLLPWEKPQRLGKKLPTPIR